VFPFSPTSTPSVSTPHASSPVSIDQFVDVAHAPVLLPNHDAGTGRGVRLELLEESISSTATPIDQASAPATHVDHTLCMAHAWPPASASSDAPADRASSAPLLTGSGPVQAPPVCNNGLPSPGPPSPGVQPPLSSPGLHSSPEYSALDDGSSSPSPSPSPAPELV
jgi:hypothetical protein